MTASGPAATHAILFDLDGTFADTAPDLGQALNALLEAYGKPTLLLRFGSGVTCAISLCALAAGAALLVTALRPALLVAAALLSLLGGAAVLLRRLYSADDGRAQQVAIGLGARLGNGALLVVLAWLALGGEGASDAVRTAFAWLLAGLVGASVIALAARPDQVVIGYKG